MKKTKTLLCVSAMVISGLSFAACSIGNKHASNDIISTPRVNYPIDIADYKLYVKADLKDYVAGIIK